MDKEKKLEIVKTYGKTETDTGSSEVQIALLTERIINLTAHMQLNKQDKHSRRGLRMLVDQRRSMLKYLEKTDITRYRAIKEKLNIR